MGESAPNPSSGGAAYLLELLIKRFCRKLPQLVALFTAEQTELSRGDRARAVTLEELLDYRDRRHELALHADSFPCSSLREFDVSHCAIGTATFVPIALSLERRS